ncbi:MAG: DNA cytosine methyltransferase [Symploca sp. SIO2C1]|nr:DNA cytosine methyltransferase [Symploca sp. SIO2C1]
MLKAKPTIDSSAPTLVTAFGGMGGVEFGAILSKMIRPIASIELNPKKPVISDRFEIIHDKNFSEFGHCFIKQTVQQVDYSVIAKPFWFHASPVCSNFSIANSLGIKESKQDISNAENVVRGINILNPQIFTLEQVPAFERGKSFKLICNALIEDDYCYHWKVVDMADYGIPQERKRLWLLAWKNGCSPWKFPPMQTRVGWWQAVKDIPFQASSMLQGQAIAIESYLYQSHANILLVERLPAGVEIKIREADQPSITIRRMMFTDKYSIKSKEKHSLINRYRFLDAMIEGKFRALNLKHIQRLCSFPDWMVVPHNVCDIPAVVGVGMGYACSPLFVKQLIECNLSNSN